MSLHPPTVVIENILPLLDGGRYPIKRAVGEDLTVEADIFKDGHDITTAVLKWRKKGEERWHETPMLPIPNGNDRWKAVCSLFANSVYEYTIEAWGDTFRTWQHEFQAKHLANQDDLKSETLEGANFVEKSAALADARSQSFDAQRLRSLAKEIRAGAPARVNEIAHFAELEGLMSAYADRAESCEFVVNPPSLHYFVSDRPAQSVPTAASEAPAKKRSKKKTLTAPTALTVDGGP